MKDKKVSFYLCLFLGFFGAHRFYEKKFVTGLIWFFTLGVYGIGWLYDIFRIYSEAFPKDREELAEKKRLKKQRREEARELLLAKRNDKVERIKQLDKDGVPYCPKCGSTHLTANKKGFGIGKAAVGGLALGPWGLLAGGIGKNKVKVTCLKCGYQFTAGRK